MSGGSTCQSSRFVPPVLSSFEITKKSANSFTSSTLNLVRGIVLRIRQKEIPHKKISWNPTG